MPGKGNSSRLRVGRRSLENQIYHVRIGTWHRLPIFESLLAGRYVVRSLIEVNSQANTLCYALMPDHLHWLLQLAPEVNLSTSVQKVKSLTTKSIRQSGLIGPEPVWQKG